MTATTVARSFGVRDADVLGLGAVDQVAAERLSTCRTSRLPGLSEAPAVEQWRSV
ncbi:hypothetical protein [Streptomyces sp. NPDC091217]|uniref:hypothetical protein n=1 Tax=Streptomyces sp. NPDC091217 TaxID=3365975 RepID=UPI0037FA78F8